VELAWPGRKDIRADYKLRKEMDKSSRFRRRAGRWRRAAAEEQPLVGDRRYCPFRNAHLVEEAPGVWCQGSRLSGRLQFGIKRPKASEDLPDPDTR